MVPNGKVAPFKVELLLKSFRIDATPQLSPAAVGFRLVSTTVNVQTPGSVSYVEDGTAQVIEGFSLSPTVITAGDDANESIQTPELVTCAL